MIIFSSHDDVFIVKYDALKLAAHFSLEFVFFHIKTGKLKKFVADFDNLTK